MGKAGPWGGGAGDRLAATPSTPTQHRGFPRFPCSPPPQPSSVDVCPAVSRPTTGLCSAPRQLRHSRGEAANEPIRGCGCWVAPGSGGCLGSGGCPVTAGVSL